MGTMPIRATVILLAVCVVVLAIGLVIGTAVFIDGPVSTGSSAE